MDPARRKFLHLAAGAAALPSIARTARAETYPSRPVRILVGYAPGGETDITARLIGPWLSRRLGQQFAVERGAGIESGLEIHVTGESHTRVSAVLLCSAGMPHPTMAWGRKREVFLVMGVSSSRTERPHGLPPAIQEPIAA